MTKNESFKRRIRARMAKTGEKYVAARRLLMEQSADRGERRWVSEPGHSDEVIRQQTGRGWDEWRALIDSWPGHTEGHAAIAAWLQKQHQVGGWWAQSITVGWERITGRRRPGQMADGTFTANRSVTVKTDTEALRQMLIADAGREALFPQMATELRSRPTSKNVRLAFDDGIAEIAIAPRPDGCATVTISHTKLDSPDHVAHWKAFWGDWLAALEEDGR